MAAYDENDTVPVAVGMMSVKLAARVSGVGLTCLKTMLEYSGVLTYSCLGALSEEEVHELCLRIRAAGFGLGHARAMRDLHHEAAAHARLKSDFRDDEVPVSTSLLSPKLYFRLSRRGLQRLEPVLAQCGVQSVSCLGSLSDAERKELESAIVAAGFAKGQVFSELCHEGSPPRVTSTKPHFAGPPSSSAMAEPDSSAPAASSSRLNELASLSRLMQVKAEGPVVSDGDFVPCDSCEKRKYETGQPPAKRVRSDVGGVAAGVSDASLTSQESKQEILATGTLPKVEPQDGEKLCSDQISKMVGESATPGKASMPNPLMEAAFGLGCSKIRIPRGAIDEMLLHLRAVPAEIVRYRDKSTAKMLDARVPFAVLALLRLRATCSGKPMSEERLSRLAVDVMEEQGYDPVRAISSLSPASLQCPASAMRVVGSGCGGVVFLVEETGIVVKVMLEDFAEQEYAIFCAFADAGLAARPIGLYGPQAVPGGKLYSIHMEAITHTLHSVLQETAPRGPRRGVAPLSESAAQRIAESLVRALQRMWDNGLVHGDLHLKNIAVKDAHMQPLVQLLDFGRSARNIAAAQSGSAEALRAGHEYDVFRLLTELCESFDKLQNGKTLELKECEKELREIKRGCRTAAMLGSWATHGNVVLPLDLAALKSTSFSSQCHDARLIAGLQAYTAEEPKALEQVESVYNMFVLAVTQYAITKLDLSFDGESAVSNRRMRQAITKRQKLCFNGYFKSNLFWGTS